MCSTRAALVAVLLLGVLSFRTPAAEPDPLDAMRRLASARFEAEQVDPETVVALRDEARRKVVVNTFQHFLAGRLQINRLIEAHADALEEGTDRVGGPASRLAGAQRRWELSQFRRTISLQKLRFGTMGVASTAEAVRAYFDAALRWAEAREAAKGSPALRNTPAVRHLATSFLHPMFFPPSERILYTLDEMRSEARDRAAIELASPVELRRNRNAAAREKADAVVAEYRGRGSVGFPWVAILEWLEAEGEGLPGNTMLAEARWEVSLAIELYSGDLHTTGRLGTAELAHAICTRLRAELAWARERDRAGLRAAKDLATLRQAAFPELSMSESVPHLAWEKTEARRREKDQLVQEWVAVARTQSLASFEEYQAGKATVESALEGSEALHEAEMAAVQGPVQRINAHRRAWERAWAIQQLSSDSGRRGTAAIADYLTHAAHHRWLRARAEIKDR